MLTETDPNQTEFVELVTILELVLEGSLIYGDSVEQVAQRLGDEVVRDDLGRRCVTRDTARRLVDERREREARRVEEQQRRIEEAAQRKIRLPVVPAQAGMTAVESMVANDPAFSTPADDFGLRRGNPREELMDEALAEGQRRIAEKRQMNADRKRRRELKEKRSRK